MFLDHSQMMFRDTDLLIDEHPSEYSMIKMEPYDTSHVLYDSHQRLAFTRQLQQHQDNTINNRVVFEGDHSFGMDMMGLMPSKLSQSPDSGLLPYSEQLKASTDYLRPYLSMYMMPSETTSSSDSSSLPQSASGQSQRELIAHEAGSQDSEDGSRQQQQQGMTMTEFGKAISSRQHAITSGANEESPLQGPSISQQSDSSPFFTNASSPTLSSAAVGLTTSSSPLSLSLSSPMTDMVESPEEIAFRRAEQNRAAQRAFRQRKQKYIKWLESKAEELDEVYRILALVRTENQQLCNLVMELDDKLSHSRSGTPKDLKRLSSPAILTLGPVSSSFDQDTTTAAAAASATVAFEGGVTSDGLGGVPGKCSTIRGIDGSLGREISMRLMNLATFPGLGSSVDQDAAMLRKLKYHPRSSNIGKSSSGSKSKMSLKVSQHSKRPGTALHNAFQPSTLLPQQQLQQQQNQQQQQQTDGSWISSSPISGSSPSLYSPSPPYPDARSAFEYVPRI
ncbi:hypothetical protein EC957_009267 [Mortierella hygrophila]|uniref:BZIP domain-containing protein n=1 Tax=Mortierella hygrophila TaxID=979708 RepID=A0A9P6FIJ9_9FUNG|nr:hypothetical protein EC957_009267 [Mortierella hygrophila]